MTVYCPITVTGVTVGFGQPIQIKPSTLMIPVYGRKPSEKALEAKIMDLAGLVHYYRFQGSGKSVQDIETYIRVLQFVSDDTASIIKDPSIEFYKKMAFQYEDFARVLGDFLIQNEEAIKSSVNAATQGGSFYGICSVPNTFIAGGLCLPLPEKLPLIVHSEDDRTVSRQVARLIYEHLEGLGVRVAMKMSQEFSEPGREGTTAHESVKVSEAIRYLMDAVNQRSIPVTSYMLLPIPGCVRLTGKEDCTAHAQRLSFEVYLELAKSWVENLAGVPVDKHMVSMEDFEKFVS